MKTYLQKILAFVFALMCAGSMYAPGGVDESPSILSPPFIHRLVDLFAALGDTGDNPNNEGFTPARERALGISPAATASRRSVRSGLCRPRKLEFDGLDDEHKLED